MVKRNNTTVIRQLANQIQAVKMKKRQARKPVAGVVKTATARARRTAESPQPSHAPVFGPVSTIDTAPTSIGNTINGSPAIVVPTADGIRIKGRDFLFNLDATAVTITGWTLVAGVPVSPLCMVSSAVKGFVQTYGEYFIHGVAFHYITAATTGNAGSVTMYINKSRAGPGLPTDSTNFLPTILSDHNTILSPIWKNCSAVYYPEPGWYSTDLFNNEGLHEQSPGELFVFSRITENILPGYLLVDYDISFRNMQANPKATVLPITRMKYTQMNLSVTALAMILGNPATVNVNANALMDGATLSQAPPGTGPGDIFKCILNLNESTFAGGTNATNLLAKAIFGTNLTIALTDGFTFYIQFITGTTAAMFPNYEAATSGASAASAFQWQNNQGAATFNLPCYVSLVATTASPLLQANI
jgi:hypothetical protein